MFSIKRLHVNEGPQWDMLHMPVVRTVEKWHLLHMLLGVTVAYAECELGIQIGSAKLGAILRSSYCGQLPATAKCQFSDDVR